MRVLLSTQIASATAPHGGPVVALRHARALARRGATVRIVAPEVEGAIEAPGVEIEGYEGAASRVPFARWRPDPAVAARVDAIVARFDPDLLYDVHGPAWPVEAAHRRGVPTVSMVGDFNWFCRRTFLVDSRLRRCAGPESAERCFGCINRDSPARQRVVRLALRHPPLASTMETLFPAERLAPHRLWNGLRESMAYLDALRPLVDRFVVGDANARSFLAAHGIDEARLVAIAQCLPAEARTARRTRPPGSGSPLRIGFVGRPHHDKGVHVIARAFDALPREADAELWIIHAHEATPDKVAPMFPSGRRFQRLLERGKVRLMRPANQEALYDLMAEVDVGCVPSLQFETPSLALLELVAQRTPVIRSESAGMDHVVRDGVNGRTFPYGDWRALRARLLEVIADPAILARWSARLPEIGSDEAYAERLLALFRGLARERQPGSAYAHA